jgi:tetratricopeptide (TPR) repeat protein
MSKLKHEDMEKDVLIEYSSRFLHFYRNNKGIVWGTGIGLVLVIGLVIGFFIYTAQQQSDAEILLGTAEQYFMNGDYERALYGDDEALTLGFVQIANNYGRTRSGNLANYYAAVAYYELEQFEDALSYMERFNPPRGIMGVGPISLHAVILSELGDHEEAARKFIDAAKWDENESTTPYNLMEAAISFETIGEYQKAREQLEIILDQYPDSQVYTDAQRMKGTLAART